MTSAAAGGPGGDAAGLPHAAVVGVRYGHGVVQVARLTVEPETVRLHDRPDRWTTMVTTRWTPLGWSGGLRVGTGAGALRLVVFGERDPGRHAAPGTILIQRLPSRCWLAIGWGQAARRRNERSLARDRLLALARQVQQPHG